MATVKKRNAQDATRKHDVDPLRKRIKALENAVKYLLRHVEILEGKRKAANAPK